MYCHSKYENGAPGTLWTVRVALEMACHHCETIGLFQIRAFLDRHIDNGDVKMGHVSFLKEKGKKNLQSFLSSCYNNSGKEKKSIIQLIPGKKTGKVMSSHTERYSCRETWPVICSPLGWCGFS